MPPTGSPCTRIAKAQIQIILHNFEETQRELGNLREKLPEVTTPCVMADTGFEHQRPISAAEWVRQRCATLQPPVPFSVVRNPHTNYLEMVAQRRTFPSAQFRPCTSDLKRGPIEKYIRSLPYMVIINCMGFCLEFKGIFV